ncbi:hypothetical protein [Conexibacter sp. DBS9H8]|uniref:hypothetical protein n=1 Tax=Conexibacter sp. DBS9H8 TaxID=2937801 RepID=UPI0020109336|nr:hypothetical protein [Conexibacter sp. DBS9H8]
MLRGVDIEPSSFRRQRGFVAAASFVALIAAAGALLTVAHFLGSVAPTVRARRAAPSSPGSAPARVSPAGPARTSGCGALPGGSQAVPTVTPAGTHWVLVGDMAEPTAPATIGPERQVDGFGECFAHSPLGALYAAANVIAAFSAQPQSMVIATLAVPGRARDLAVRQAADGDNRDLEQIAGGPSTLVGFSFQGYSPQEAEISLAIQGPSGAQGAVPLVMDWVGDDWRFVVPPGGQGFAATALASMAGFVAWSAG